MKAHHTKKSCIDMRQSLSCHSHSLPAPVLRNRSAAGRKNVEAECKQRLRPRYFTFGLS